MTTRNRYYLCVPGENSPISFDPPNINPLILQARPDCVYYSRILEEVERNLGPLGLTFYLTWDTNKLPSYSDRVVAIILGDEKCLIPKYAHRVKMIFKCYGTHPKLTIYPLSNGLLINIVSFLQFIRNLLNWLPGFVISKFFSCFRNCQIKIYDIPLGYFNLKDLPLRAITDRNYDVSFIGSIGRSCHSRWSLKYWIGTPKSRMREIMGNSLALLQRKTSYNIYLEHSSDEINNVVSEISGINYSEIMNKTKICLVPRGTSLETFRFFEALKCGCIIIAEDLPSRWFYEQSPAIRIKDWKDLNSIISPLLANKEMMQYKHEKTLDWWREKCSEIAVANYITEKINICGETK